MEEKSIRNPKKKRENITCHDQEREHKIHINDMVLREGVLDAVGRGGKREGVGGSAPLATPACTDLSPRPSRPALVGGAGTGRVHSHVHLYPTP